MFCKKCGKQTIENNKYCTNCGSTIREESAAVNNLSVVENNVAPSAKKKSKSMKVPFIVTSIIAIVAIIIIVFILLFNDDSNRLMNENCPRTECEIECPGVASNYIPCSPFDEYCIQKRWSTDDLESIIIESEDGLFAIDLTVPVGLGWRVTDDNKFTFLVHELLGECQLSFTPVSNNEDVILTLYELVYGYDPSTRNEVSARIDDELGFFTMSGGFWGYPGENVPIQNVPTVITNSRFAPPSAAQTHGLTEWITTWPVHATSWQRPTTFLYRGDNGAVIAVVSTNIIGPPQEVCRALANSSGMFSFDIVR